MLVDQFGSVLDYSTGSEPKPRPSPFERLLGAIGGLTEAEAAAIYALRNAFVHSYGLVNDPDPSNRRRALLRHTFHLNVGGTELVVFDDRTDVEKKPIHVLPATEIDLGCLGDLVESIVATIRRRHLDREHLPWKVDHIDTFAALSFFEHHDSIQLRTV